MNMLKPEIEKVARETAENSGFFLIDIILRGNERNRIIEIYIDAEKNVTAEDCAAFSRLIGEKIEEKNLIDSSYRLDVSSPGVERPLVYLKQFPKHINRKFEIEYLHGDELKTFAGRLIGINNEFLTFSGNKKDELIVSFNNIKKAKVVISFS